MLRYLAMATSILAVTFSSASAQDMQAPSVVVAEQEATLASRMAGLIDAFPLGVGDRFQAGDTLVRFDCALQIAARDSARFTLDAAEAENAVNARLLKSGAISRTEAAITQARVGSAKADLSGADAQVALCEIRAPFSGIVVEVAAAQFETVQASQDLLRVVSDLPPRVDLIAPSEWLQWLKPGQQGEVRLFETGKAYPAVINALPPIVNAVSKSIKLEAQFTGEAAGVLPGMSGIFVTTGGSG